jgi:hypothetical protein
MQLTGAAIAASEATDDDRIKKLADYATKLVTEDPNAVRVLLKELAAQAAPQPYQVAAAPPPLKRSKPKPPTASAPAMSNDEIIANAKELLAKMESIHEQRSGTTAVTTDQHVGKTEPPSRM